jgi:Protein of unknown function (DUF1592)/Protein of unknown function (DUF1588)/Protein of unknown function (DUF1595)/Protein of unknown function (DUF1587)/Protein of unknown function (DUF1585)
MKRAEENVRRLVRGVAVLALGACSGQIQGGAGAGTTGSAGMSGAAGAVVAGYSGAAGAAGATTATTDGWPAFAPTTAYGLRRLTNEQYANTVRTLLGVSTTGMPAIEKVSPVGGFSAIGASTAAVSGAGVGQFEDAARFVAHAAFDVNGPRAKLVPCTPTGATDAACLGKFVSAFGARAFRRPLTADEATRYTAAATAAAMATGDAWQGIEAITSAFLQSPNFLYLTELGAPDPQTPARNKLTGPELASRLSYFLTNDMPDDTLLAAATAGTLGTPEGVQAQATRLLALPAARAAVGSFFGTMLSLDSLDTLTRPTALFPKFTATLGAAMKQETALVLDDLVFARDGDYRHLFDQPETFVNAELAGLYGVPAPVGPGFSRVTLPASAHRAGLLGQAGVLAARDHSDGTSPTRRGLFILTRLLCQNLPLAPPANLTIPPPPTGVLTARQKLDQHASNGVCAACHKQMDPVGLSLEHLDAMGVYRETDHGLPIDDAGTLAGKPYQGEVGLGAALRDHPALGPCLTQALYGVGVGHLPTEFDRAPFGAMVKAYDASGARLRALLTSIVTSDGFRFLPPPN